MCTLDNWGPDPGLISRLFFLRPRGRMTLSSILVLVNMLANVLVTVLVNVLVNMLSNVGRSDAGSSRMPAKKITLELGSSLRTEIIGSYSERLRRNCQPYSALPSRAPRRRDFRRLRYE